MLYAVRFGARKNGFDHFLSPVDTIPCLLGLVKYSNCPPSAMDSARIHATARQRHLSCAWPEHVAIVSVTCDSI
eukprot:1385737-Amorphochlora_amoeboformis.AAC.2